MNQAALELCAAALSCSSAEVEAMWEEASLLPALQAATVLQLRLGGASQSPHSDLVRAIAAGWGAKAFTAAELLEWCAQCGTPLQIDVDQAARTACGPGGLTAQRLGMALRKIAAAPPTTGLRLMAAGEIRGSQLWEVRDLRD